jgi:EAL domain-containing protein (putative c-di-GMP-specific phosphodiesterase class I)
LRREDDVHAARDQAYAVTGQRPRVIYLSPQGRRLDQRGVQELASGPPLVVVAGRYEGSKYLILLNTGDEKQIKKKSDRLLKAIEEHICEVSGKSVHVQCHIGASIIDDSSLEVNEVMSRADRALTECEDDDQKRLNIYRPKEGEMTQKQLDAAWIKRLKAALEEKCFHLLFQPIVQLDGGEMERYEVFMEMRDEEGDRVSTGEFMPAAERTKMSKVLDRWVISQALQRLKERKSTHPKTVFFIKLSGGSLEDLELFRWISEKVKGIDLPKWSLIFEVKEEAVVSHLKQAQAFATLLKTIHCGFAIDDLGKGPDPFKLVELVPAQYLKFDKDFTADLSSNKQNQETLKEITEKARKLKKHAIVQHVEDAATLSVLWTIGANFTQGNFFQGPSSKIDYDFSSGIG